MEFNDPKVEEIVNKLITALKENNNKEAEETMDILLYEYPEVANVLMQSVEFRNLMMENAEKLEEKAKQMPIEDSFEDKYEIDEDKIINDMNAMLDIEPQTLEEFIQKGTVQTITEDFDGALESFDKALELDKNNIIALISKANTYEIMGEDEKALDIYDIVMETDTEDPNDLISKGFILEKNERFDDALKCYNKALKKDKDNSNILFLKGSCLISLEDYEQAIENLEKSIETYDLNPHESVFELANAYHNKGVALHKLNKTKEALEQYTLALGLNPEYSPSYYEIGQIQEERENYKNALDNYNKCLEYNSTNSQIIESIKRVEKKINTQK